MVGWLEKQPEGKRRGICEITGSTSAALRSSSIKLGWQTFSMRPMLLPKKSNHAIKF